MRNKHAARFEGSNYSNLKEEMKTAFSMIASICWLLESRENLERKIIYFHWIGYLILIYSTKNRLASDRPIQ